MTARSARLALGLAAAVLVGAGALAMPSCTAQPLVRHLTADQDGLTEAGRALAVSEVTLRLHQRYQALDPPRWRELASRAGQLSQAAGRLILSRATAVAGSSSDAERFYAQLGSDTAALRALREKLEADLSESLPRPAP
jgi:hypothetical protein